MPSASARIRSTREKENKWAETNRRWICLRSNKRRVWKRAPGTLLGASYCVYTESVFEWDLSKASANLSKHDVTFEEATTVFMDERGLDGPDLLHSTAESRFLRLGQSANDRILIVAYTKRRAGDAETIRIISARKASRKERKAYEKARQD